MNPGYPPINPYGLINKLTLYQRSEKVSQCVLLLSQMMRTIHRRLYQGLGLDTILAEHTILLSDQNVLLQQHVYTPTPLADPS